MLNKNLISQITEMYAIDQGVRKLARPGREAMNFLIYTIDISHNYRIWKLIHEWGYPTKKIVGKSILHKFWLLVQHQDFDSKLQEACLENCGFDPKDRANLTDRLLVKQNKKQIYGTQFKRTGDKLVPYPIQNKNSVNIRRRSVGLDSLESQSKKAIGNFQQLMKRRKVSL